MRVWAGAKRPEPRASSPQLLSVFVVFGCAFAFACSSQEQTRNLEPDQVGLTPDVAPIFEDDESQLFEVKRGLQFPILEPSGAEADALNQQVVEPYGRKPWITNQDVKVQLTWTLSNLDEDQHVVELLIDPWNEFGRYYPGMTLTDAEEQTFKPNFSGIDRYYVLEGKSAGASSRRHGTCTFDDMNEMAIDFATVQNMIKFPPPLPERRADGPGHGWSIRCRSTPTMPSISSIARTDDLLVAPYIPAGDRRPHRCRLRLPHHGKGDHRARHSNRGGGLGSGARPRSGQQRKAAGQDHRSRDGRHRAGCLSSPRTTSRARLFARGGSC